MRGFTTVAALAAALLLVVACSEETPAIPSADPSSDVPTSEMPDGGETGAPADTPEVANPVQNIDKFKQDPCAMLAKAQAAELGADAKIERDPDDSQGPRCRWHAGDDSFFSITLLKNQPLGIGGLYRNHQEDPEFYAYFEPVNIDGFPGVLADSNDSRPNGACALAVGITDQQVMSLVSSVEGSGDPCTILTDAAHEVVATMSQG